MVSGTGRIMWSVSAALLPGLAALSVHFGSGHLRNIAIAWPLACALDWAAAKARQRPVDLADGSVTLTALILALALPPAAAWHTVAVATAGAVLLARQLYGGLGHNIFNPAMAGYAIALVCYPLAMGAWPPLVDGHTGATALTALKYRDGLTVAEAFRQNPAFGHFGGRAWEQASLAFAAGGLWLMLRGLIAWRVVAAFLVTLVALALLFNDGGSSSGAGPPLFHLLSGGTLLAAFFVITDPVTHPGSRPGQWLFGGVTATIAFVIRAWGGYPDGIAFAVLIANAATPLIDRAFRQGFGGQSLWKSP